MTVSEILQEAVPAITARDAEVLLGDVLEVNRAWLLAHPEGLLTSQQIQAFRATTRRRAAAEPLQYIIGKQEFYGLPFQVGPEVLIPRPETELLVEAVLGWAAEVNAPGLRIVDVGTGSGAIALSLASKLLGCDILATDISAGALQVAEGNAQSLGLAARVRFQLQDLLEAVEPDSVDAVVSNPPYIPQGDAPGLQREVVEHEPHTALFAGADGLDIYRRLIPQAHKALRIDSLLAMEFGWSQRDSLARLLQGWNDVVFIDDYAGVPRIVLARKAR